MLTFKQVLIIFAALFAIILVFGGMGFLGFKLMLKSGSQFIG